MGLAIGTRSITGRSLRGKQGMLVSVKMSRLYYSFRLNCYQVALKREHRFANQAQTMKRAFVLLALCFAVTRSADAQLRITSFTAGGEMVWTNPAVARGFYSVEGAGSPAGPWQEVTNVADLDWSLHNGFTVQVARANQQAFYRVAWMLPDPTGTWDCYGYDLDGSLAITGKLTLARTVLMLTNPITQYRIEGTRAFGYVGSVSNAPWYLGPLVRTDWPYSNGPVGTWNLNSAQLAVWWPTNCYDCAVGLRGTLPPNNTFTGLWEYSTWVGPYVGRFEAARMPSTNLMRYKPQSTKQQLKQEIPP